MAFDPKSLPDDIAALIAGVERDPENPTEGGGTSVLTTRATALPN